MSEERERDRCDTYSDYPLGWIRSELKRRIKQRQKDAEKAEKAAKVPPAAPKANTSAAAAVEEEELSPTQYYERRVRIIQKLRESRQPDPYPHKFHVSISLTEFIEKYQDRVQDGTQLQGEEVTVAGRLHNMRSGGPKLRFYDLHGEGVKIQVFAQIQ